MKRPVMKCATAMIVPCMVVPVLLHAAQEAHPHQHNERQIPSGKNPLIEEMVILDGVFREVVSAVSLGDGARVHTALESMHGTMEKPTRECIQGLLGFQETATDWMSFCKWTKSFTGIWRPLAQAAHAIDQQAMLVLTMKLLEGCLNCHRTFRE